MKCARACIRATWAVSALVAVVCITPSARADALNGPVVVGGRPAAPLISLQPPTGSFNFDYLYEHDTTKQQGLNSGTTDNRAQETVDVLTNGYILSPNFLILNLGGLIGLQQETFSEPGSTRNTDGVLDGWDVSSTLLPNEGAPLTLYTRRDEQILTPDFSPSLDSIDTTYGGALALQNNVAPTQFQLYHDDDTQTQAGDILNYELRQDVFHWHTDVISLPHQSLTWDFNYDNTTEKEDNSPAIKYEDYDASLTHVWTFGPQDVHSLTTALSLSDQIGDLGYEEFDLDENLRLQHSPIFQTHYDYSLDTTNVDGDDQTNNKLDIGFVHHLFDSLVTTADMGGSFFNETGGSDVQLYYGTVNFGYRKTVTAGEFLANLNLGTQWQKSAEGDQVVHVINQAETFTDSQPLVLTQTNIDPKSIQVLSAAGVPYLNTRDFVVNRVGNLTQIERVVGGLIPPGSTVKLDYNLLPQPSNITTTNSLGVNARYEIDAGPLAGLAPYVRYGLQRQSIDSDDSDAFVPESYNDVVIGADYTLWKVTFNGEQEWRDDTLVPYNATRFSARYSQLITRDTTASFGAGFADYDYYGEHDIVNDTSITAAVEKRLNTEWTVNARVVFLNDRDELFGNTQGLEEQLEVDWARNQTKVFGRIRNSTLESQDEQETFQVLEFGISRSF
jgi:hypothetical protein